MKSFSSSSPAPADALRERVRRLDGQDYAAYQSLRGRYRFPGFDLAIERVPKDPYAPPGTGVFRLVASRKVTGLTARDTRGAVRAVAVSDYLARCFAAAVRAIGPGRRGTGHSGEIAIAEPGPAVLDRTSVCLDELSLEVRCFVGLPAQGRRILAPLAEAMLFDELPTIAHAALAADTLDRAALDRHVHTVEDAHALRDQLTHHGLVAFVADGAVLPRASGIDPAPLHGEGVVSFTAPEGLRTTLTAPYAGPVTGMGVAGGVTLLVGGGFHGKSTLLTALAEGVYDHAPGDGRERCVSLPEAMTVRAAPGRAVTATDVSAFIGALPDGRDSSALTTMNASGSTSQAAAVAEAIEADARLLLIDEDTSATNFLVRDARMQRLVRGPEEPITVLLDHVRALHDALGISTILAMGGSGDYFDAADHVIQLLDYQPRDVSARAHEIAAALPSARTRETLRPLTPPAERLPLGGGLDPVDEHGHRSIRALTPRRIAFGRAHIDLDDVEQLLEHAQAQAIGLALERLSHQLDGQRTLRAALDAVSAQIERDGLDVLDPLRGGTLAGFRTLELAAALNRVRALDQHRATTPP